MGHTISTVLVLTKKRTATTGTLEQILDNGTPAIRDANKFSSFQLCHLDGAGAVWIREQS